MSGGNSHDRRKFERAVEREVKKAKAKGEVVPIAEVASPGTATVVPAPKSDSKLLLFFEHPLFLTPVGILCGLVGMLFYTPVLIVCEICIALAFHRAGVVRGKSVVFQGLAYVGLLVLTSIGMYSLGIVLRENFHIPTATEIADAVVGKMRATGPSPTKGSNESNPKPLPPTANPPRSVKPTPTNPSREEPKASQRMPELEGGFHEVTDSITVSLGAGGISASRKIADLKDQHEPWIPFIIEDNIPIRVSLIDNKLLFTFKAWGGRASEPPIEVTNNEVRVHDPFVDRNYSANAFEVVATDGTPVFQMIRKTPAQMVINGVFPTGTTRQGTPLFIWAWTGGFVPSHPQPPPDFVLKPIFKYPAWKYPGKYAEE